MSAAGNIVARYDYDPDGTPTQVQGSMQFDFLYTGHFYHAQTQLHLAPFRAYNSVLGRWLSREPLGLDGPNLYHYAFNNPLSVVDSTGLFGEWITGALDSIGSAVMQPIADALFDNGYRFFRDSYAAATCPNPAARSALGAYANSVSDALPTIASASMLPAGMGKGSGTFVPESYWKSLTKKAPEQSIPYNVLPKYDIDGNFKGVTTYDKFGNRAYQYEAGSKVRHGEGYHTYDNSGRHGGFGKGTRSHHLEY